MKMDITVVLLDNKVFARARFPLRAFPLPQAKPIISVRPFGEYISVLLKGKWESFFFIIIILDVIIIIIILFLVLPLLLFRFSTTIIDDNDHDIGSCGNHDNSDKNYVDSNNDDNDDVSNNDMDDNEIQ